MAGERDTAHALGTGAQRRVVRTSRARGELRVTCVFERPILLSLDPHVRELVCRGAVHPDLPAAVVELLHGYRVRSRLGALPGLAEVVAADVSRIDDPALTSAAAAYGYARVTVRCPDGGLLVDTDRTLALADKLALLDDLVRVVDELGARGVAHPALAPAGVAAAGGTAWVVDLAPLSDDAGPPVSGDHAVAPVARWLLEDELAQPDPPAALARWRRAPEPASPAPSAPATPASDDGRDTQFVPDGTLFGQPQPRAADLPLVDDATVFVPDDAAPPPPRQRPRRRGLALALAVVAALLIAGLARASCDARAASRVTSRGSSTTPSALHSATEPGVDAIDPAVAGEWPHRDAANR